jgi:multidrug resistance protein, MATE family
MSQFLERSRHIMSAASPIRTELQSSLHLAIPLICAQVAQATTGFVDTVAMGWLGQDALASGGLAATTFSTLLVTATGVVMAVSPLIAEAHGGGNSTKIRQIAQQGLWLSLLLALPIMVLLAHTDVLMARLGQRADTVALAKRYLDVMLWGFLPALLFAMIKGVVSSLSQTRPIMVIVLVGTAFNAIGNYLLGLGNLGFPKMGLGGIALASTLSYWGMLLCLVLYVLNHKSLKNYRLFYEWYRVRLKLLRELIWLGVPIGISFALEIGLYAVTAYLMGILGTEALAAYQIVIQTIVILFMIPVGIGYATTIRVGQWHGQKNLQGVKQAAVISIGLSATFMALTAVLLIGFPQSLIALYLNLNNPGNVSVISLATAMFTISAFSQLFDGIQTTAAGALRGLQDTRIPMLLSLLAFWVIGLSSGYVLGFVFNFGAIGLWIGQSLGVGVAALVFVWRLHQLMSKLSY